MRAQIAFLAACFTACAATPKVQKQPELSAEDKKKADEMLIEMEVGRAMTGRLLAAYQVNESKNLNDYISLIGTYVAQNSDWGGRRFMFAITQDTGISAFSCPGGYVLMSLGSIKAAQNEAELAGVLAHEISHVGRQHILNIIKKRTEAKPKGQAWDNDTELKGRQRDKPSGDSAAGASISKYLGGSSGAVISVFQAASGGLSALLDEGLDQEMEYEADKDGITTAMRAGYDGNAYIAYMERLAKQKGTAAAAVLDKTHPPLTTRIEKLKAEFEKLKVELPGKTLAADRFKKTMAAAKIEIKAN